MKKLLSISALLFSLLFSSLQAQAVGVRPNDMTASGAIVGTQIIWCPIGTVSDLKCTFNQVAAFVFSLVSGDISVNSTGTSTLATVNANVGSFGSATNCVTFTTNGKGLITAASQATCTPAIASVTGLGTGVATFLATPSSANLAAALTDETGTGVAVFGTAPTISSPTINTAATFGFITGSTQCLHVNTSGVLSGTGSDCGSGAGSVSSVTGGTGITVSPTTGAVVVSASVTARNNTATSDTLVTGDAGTVVTESNASPVAVAIAQAGTAGFASGQYWTLKNKGAGLVTITPATSTIDGAATLTVKQNQSVDFYSDGTNYITLPARPTNVACADLTNGTALCSTTPGTGVATAAAANLSAAGGLTSTIASGTSALGTSAIGSAACASVVTTAATNTATTDVVLASFNGDPTAVTGYVPLTTGMLTIISYPSANNVNFKVCNNTSSSITPGAITLNWRVVR